MRAPNQSDPSAGAPAGRETTLGRHLRILCADDNVFLGGILVQMFKRAGHSAEHVPNGVDAWDRLSRAIGDFDVVVTDHEMPGLNGLELVELLREARFGGRIVLYTSGVTPCEIESYRRFGVAAVVLKAPQPTALLQAVETN